MVVEERQRQSALFDIQIEDGVLQLHQKRLEDIPPEGSRRIRFRSCRCPARISALTGFCLMVARHDLKLITLQLITLQLITLQFITLQLITLQLITLHLIRFEFQRFIFIWKKL